jgi:hypothetical protein
VNTIASPVRPTTPDARDGLLRSGIRLDASVSGAFGFALLVSGGLLADMVGIPLRWLLAVGGVCLLYAASLWLLHTCARVSQCAGLAVIVANATWVAGSGLLVAFGWLPLTVLGVGFVLLQAIAVAGLTGLQVVGLRRMRS